MKLGCGRALALVLGAALLFSTSFADNEGTGYRVESRQRFDGLTVDRFDRYAFQQSVASYFKIDVSLVVINNVYYADGGVNVDYYCYFVRAQRGGRGRGDAAAAAEYRITGL